MSLIERYVLAVMERLPEDIRYDVADELRSNIEDMLPENPTDSDIREVLEKMGNPKKLAQEYNSTKKYLIGPGLYDSYFSVLKTVVGIAVTIIVCISLFDWAVGDIDSIGKADLWVEMFAELLATAITGGLQAAFIVTLVFAVMERSGISEGELPFVKKKWSLDDLPTAPISKKAKISRAETIFSMFCTILFAALLYFKPQLIAMYLTKDGTIDIIPLFNIDRLHHYIIAILLIALVQLCTVIWKFVQRRWTVPLAIVNAVQNAAVSLLVILLFNDRMLFNQAFFTKLSEIFKLPEVKIMETWFLGTSLFTIVIFTGICIWDSVSAFLKCKR
ncbi:MAG: hypothetical protein K0R50_2223 [Eubacterium sp.]|nr:hypothetical protein [Eubacterium sp.]